MKRLALLLLAFGIHAAAADPALLKLAMPDARIAAGMNVAQARNSPFGQFLLSRISTEGSDFQNFVKATGFDPRHNLDEFLLTSPGGAGENRNLFVVRGTFDPQRILELAKSAGAEIGTYQGFDILRAPASNSPHGTPGSLVFLDSTIAIAGDDQSVREAIDRRQTGPGLSRELAAKVDELSGSQDAWFVSLVPVSELASRVPSGDLGGALKVDSLRAIEQANGGVRFAELVALTAEIVASTPQDATGLADVIKFLSGLAQLRQPKSGQDDRFRQLLNGLQVKAEGASVKLALTIPEQELESIVRSSRP